MAMKSCKITVHLLWNSMSQETEITWLENSPYCFGITMKFVVQKKCFLPTSLLVGLFLFLPVCISFKATVKVTKAHIALVSTHLCKHTYTVPLTTNELSEHSKHVIGYELPTGWPTIDWASSAAACVHVAQGQPFQLQLNASIRLNQTATTPSSTKYTAIIRMSALYHICRKPVTHKTLHWDRATLAPTGCFSVLLCWINVHVH